MPPFTFTIPNLPRKTYEFVRRASKAYRLSQRHVVIVALDLLNEEGVRDKARVEALFQRVLETYPRRVRRC